MATKRDTKPSKVRITGRYLNLNTNRDIDIFLSNLIRIGMVESLDAGFLQIVRRHLNRVLKSYLGKYTLIKGNYGKEEFRKATKRHQRDLNKILTEIVGASSAGEQVNITYRGDRVRIILGTQIVYDQDVKPRSFSCWYNCLKLYNYPEYLGSHTKVVILTRMLSTVFSVGNEPKLGPGEFKSQALESISNIIDNTSGYTSKEDYLYDDNEMLSDEIKNIKDTIEEIKFYSSSNVEVPAWAKDIVRSLKRLYRQSYLYTYDNSRPHMSSASSCTYYKYKGRNYTLPGLFGSMFEPDYADTDTIKEFDTIVGFKQSYGVVDRPEFVDTHRRLTVGIPQKKPKVRIIHMLNNSEQDRLNYFHKLISSCLKSIVCDCTFDQSKGPRFIRETMAASKKRAIYSLDLSSATDTFNIGLQYRVIKDLIFNEHEHADILARTWLDLVSVPSVYKVDGSEIDIKFQNGQPQGYLSSFDSFALSHHIVILTVLRLWDPDKDPSQFYRILGDDIVFADDDQEMDLPDLYISHINAANVVCNLDKGYIYNPYTNEYQTQIAEFAKYLMVTGIDITPIPFKLLMAKTIGEHLGLLAWYSEHREEKLSLANLNYYMNQYSPVLYDAYKDLFELMIHLDLPSILEHISTRSLYKYGGNFNTLDFKVMRVFLTYSIIYSAVDMLLKYEDTPGVSDLIKLSGSLSWVLEHLDDVPNDNKVSILKDNLSESVIGLRSLLAEYHSTDIDDETLEIISLFMQTKSQREIENLTFSILDILDIFTINPDFLTDQEANQYCERMSRYLREFRIDTDRSWSSYRKKLPTSFLKNVYDPINEIMEKEFQDGIRGYLDSQGANYNSLPEPVRAKDSGILRFLSYEELDWVGDDDDYEDIYF